MAQSIKASETTYNLTDEKGKFGWTLDDIGPFQTANGTVKEIWVPKNPPLTFTLTTDQGELTFKYDGSQAEKLGFTLVKDEKITVTYWSFAGSPRGYLRDITPDGGKTYTFTDGTDFSHPSVLKKKR